MRQQALAERDQFGLVGPAQIVFLAFRKHRDQKVRDRTAAEQVNGAITTALAAPPL
jgi:hypothetical protein